MGNNCFTKNDRLLHSSQFQFVFHSPKRIACQCLTILYRNNNDSSPRLGLIVAKKQFKKAVTRNLVKRKCREKFRTTKNLLPNIDIVVLPKKGLMDLTAHEINELMDLQWQRLLKKSTS